MIVCEARRLLTQGAEVLRERRGVVGGGEGALTDGAEGADGCKDLDLTPAEADDAAGEGDGLTFAGAREGPVRGRRPALRRPVGRGARVRRAEAFGAKSRRSVYRVTTGFIGCVDPEIGRFAIGRAGHQCSRGRGWELSRMVVAEMRRNAVYRRLRGGAAGAQPLSSTGHLGNRCLAARVPVRRRVVTISDRTALPRYFNTFSVTSTLRLHRLRGRSRPYVATFVHF